MIHTASSSRRLSEWRSDETVYNLERESSDGRITDFAIAKVYGNEVMILDSPLGLAQNLNRLLSNAINRSH